MDQYYNFSELNEQLELLEQVCLTLFILLILVVIRNWYNLYKKRTFRKSNRLLEEQLAATKIEMIGYDDQLKNLSNLENRLISKQAEVSALEKEMISYKEKFYATLSDREKEIANQKQTINHQKKAYERYVNFKNVEANNTRLGAHFIKNVISQIYEDLEEIDANYRTIWGFQFKIGVTKKKIPSIKALKNIFKLLDYNVSALNRDSASLDDELHHINMFLELIQYLKPNAKIELNNSLSNNQINTLRIKPTLFFPFIENALKHGSLNELNSFISIDLKETDQKEISYCLINSAEQKVNNKLDSNVTSKFGLSALKELLDAYYPGSKLECAWLPNTQYMSQLTLSINK